MLTGSAQAREFELESFRVREVASGMVALQYGVATQLLALMPRTPAERRCLLLKLLGPFVLSPPRRSDLHCAETRANAVRVPGGLLLVAIASLEDREVIV